jgi:Leucine-rich repeat (LRR) protein
MARLEWPHDIIKSCLDFSPDKELIAARLVSKKWLLAVADSVEGFLYLSHQHRRKLWKDTFVDGVWNPQTNLQLRLFQCSVQHFTESFRQSIQALVAGMYVVPGSLQGLQLLPTLQKVDLTHSAATSLTVLSGCLAMQSLRLGSTKVADDSIRRLGLAATLEELDLSETKVTNIQCLSTYRVLRKLILFRCLSLTDSGVYGIQSIPTLEELDLSGTQLTSVNHLASCKSLRKLKLSGCRKIGNGGARGLKQILTLEVLDLSLTRAAAMGLEVIPN